MTERLTLVTGLFDLARREPGSSRRTAAQYLEFGGFVLGLDQDLVVFVDRELEREVVERRRQNGLLDRTLLVPTALEDMPAYQSLAEIVAARDSRPLLNGDPQKDTPLYAVLQWSKFAMLEEAMARDPFGASHFGWIDLGLAHVCITRHCAEDEVFARPPHQVRALMMRSPAQEVADLGTYYLHLWGHLAAAYLPGRRASMLELCRRAAAAIAEAVQLGFAPSDEQVLGVLAAQEPDLFEFHYGDYPHTLANYRRIRGSSDNLLYQLQVCRATGQFERADDLGRGVVESCNEGTFAEDATAVLDEYNQIAR